MAVLAPIITSSTPPSVQVSMAGAISYSEFIYMLGNAMNLQVRELFIETSQGFNREYNYNIFNATGQANQESLKPRKDPYQRQNSLFIKPQGNQPMIFNGQSFLSFSLFPLETMSLTLCVDQSDFTIMAPGRVVDNFKIRTPDLPNTEFYNQLKDCL